GQITRRLRAVSGELHACDIPERETPARAAVLKGVDLDLELPALCNHVCDRQRRAPRVQEPATIADAGVCQLSGLELGAGRWTRTGLIDLVAHPQHDEIKPPLSPRGAGEPPASASARLRPEGEVRPRSHGPGSAGERRSRR